MAEHSKLPWFFYELSPNSRGEQDGCGYIRCETDNLEISHHGDMKRSRDENVANAALIVRAVNSHDALVAAMEEAISRLETVQDDVGYQFDGDFTSPQDKLLSRLRAVLASALPTGEAE